VFLAPNLKKLAEEKKYKIGKGKERKSGAKKKFRLVPYL